MLDVEQLLSERAASGGAASSSGLNAQPLAVEDAPTTTHQAAGLTLVLGAGGEHLVQSSLLSARLLVLATCTLGAA